MSLPGASVRLPDSCRMPLPPYHLQTRNQVHPESRHCSSPHLPLLPQEPYTCASFVRSSLGQARSKPCLLSYAIYEFGIKYLVSIAMPRDCHTSRLAGVLILAVTAFALS